MYMKILKRISENIEKKHHYVKSTHSRSYSGPHFPAFGLNTEKQAVSLRIQSECSTDQNNSEYGHFSRRDKDNTSSPS